jgi:membrane protein YqaA with SNARE-associated domain
MLDLATLGGLFLVAFGAATLLPMGSEAALVALLLGQTHAPWLLIAVASIGNVAGSAVNWALGRSIERFRDRRWFPADAASLDRAEAWYRRWGRWSLLLSWVPVIGDPLTVIAGVMRERFVPFLLVVAIAKVGRYLVVAGITLGWA